MKNVILSGVFMLVFVIGVMIMWSNNNKLDEIHSNDIIDVVDSIQNDDLNMIHEEFGDSGVLISRIVTDSTISSTYMVNDTTVSFMHYLNDTSCVEEIQVN